MDAGDFSIGMPLADGYSFMLWQMGIPEFQADEQEVATADGGRLPPAWSREKAKVRVSEALDFRLCPECSPS